MSIASEITRISENIAAAYTALENKGATLPASGSQNSANLADTIDTVSTGGGNRYDTLKQMIDAVSYDETEETLAAKGWTRLSHFPNTSNLRGSNFELIFYVFSKETPQTIYYQTPSYSGCFFYLFDATLDTTAQSITFADADDVKVIGVIGQNLSSYPTFNTYGPTAPSGKNFAQGANKSYLYGTETLFVGYKKFGSTDYTTQSPYIKDETSNVTRWGGELPGLLSLCLEDFYCPNFKITLSVTNNQLNLPNMDPGVYYLFLFRQNKNMSPEKIASLYTNITPEVTYIKGNIVTSNRYHYNLLSQTVSSPIVFDLSDYTSSSQIFIGSGSANSSSGETYHGSFGSDLFVIPPTSADIYWKSDRGSGGTYSPISARAFKFFANNAPTASNRKIKIGYTAYSDLVFTYSSYVSALSAKGWTVGFQ